MTARRKQRRANRAHRDLGKHRSNPGMVDHERAEDLRTIRHNK